MEGRGVFPSAGSTGAELKAPRAPRQGSGQGWGAGPRVPAAVHPSPSDHPGGASGRSPCPSSWPVPGTHAPRGFHLKGATGWRSPQIFRGEPDPPPKILWCLRQVLLGTPGPVWVGFFPTFPAWPTRRTGPFLGAPGKPAGFRSTPGRPSGSPHPQRRVRSVSHRGWSGTEGE